MRHMDTGEAVVGTGKAVVGTGEAVVGTGKAVVGTGEAVVGTGEAVVGSNIVSTSRLVTTASPVSIAHLGDMRPSELVLLSWIWTLGGCGDQ